MAEEQENNEPYQDEPYQDEQFQENLSNSPKAKKSRGATIGKRSKKITEPMFIEFDQMNRPCGKWQAQYSSQVGILGRQIDITIDDWDKVAKGLKNTIWLDLKKMFHIDACWEHTVLSHVGTRWKDFKSNLTSLYVLKTRKQNRKVPLEDPLTLYGTHITKAQWEKFKKSREEEAFKKKSEVGRTAQSYNKYPHYTGRSGYAGKRDQWLREELESAKSRAKESNGSNVVSTVDSVASLLSDRSYTWIRAHTPSSGKAPPEHTQQVIDKIKHWQEKAKNGEFVANRLDDVLAAATNKKDHSGRTRGVGSRVGLQTYFGKPKTGQTRGQLFTAEDVRLLLDEAQKETLSKTDVMVRHYLKLAGVQLPQGMEIDKPTPPTLHDRSSCHSAEPYPFDEAKDTLLCRLGVELESGDFIIVAEGTFWPSEPGFKVHNVPLMVGHVRVSIDTIIERKAPLPVCFDDFKLVGEVEGSFAQWPKTWVVVDENEVSKGTGEKPNDKVVRRESGKDTKGSITKNDRGALVQDDVYHKLGRQSQILHDMLKQSSKDVKMYHVLCPIELYHYEEVVNISVSVEDIKNMFELDWLNTPILQIWGRYLCEIGTGLGVDIGYMCPERLSSIAIDPLETENYMVHVMRACQDKRFIMGPYYEKNHWMLIVICPERNEAYFMDSANCDRKILLKNHLNIAFKLYCFNGGNHDVGKGRDLSWPKTECPQQPGGFECAYYVMKFMYDIVVYHSKKKELTKCFKDPTLPPADIKQVRDNWSEYFTEKCF